MIVGAATEGPEKFSLRFSDRQIVYAGDPTHHEAVGSEFPVFVPVGTEPVSALLVPFVGETDSDPVFTERPEFLDQPVIQLLCPFLSEKCDDSCAAGEKFRSIAPNAIDGVSCGNFSGIAAIPAILSEANLLFCRF